MIRKFKQLLAVSLVVAGLTASLVALPVEAAGTFQSAACAGVNQVGSDGCDSNPGSTISNLFASALNILSLIAGFAAVLMIIISGIRFITAQGDSSSIATARQSLLYALIGLVVASLAQIIVHFVLGKVTGAQ